MKLIHSKLLPGQVAKSILLVIVLFYSNNIISQNCSGCTTTISTASSTNYTVSSGQTLCITSSGSVTGIITLSGGTICNEGTFNPGIFSFQSGTFNNYGTYNSTSTLSLSGSCTFTNYSTISLGGVFMTSVNANFSNNGTATISGSLTMSGGIFTNDGPLTTSGISKSGGTFTNNNDITCSSMLSNSGGAFTNNSNLTCNGPITNSGGTFTNNSIITNCAGITSNGGTFNNNNLASITVTGNFTNSIAFNNKGPLIISGNFTNNGGTFSLSDAGKINCADFSNLSTFNLGNGTIVHCTNFTNLGTIAGPGGGAGCGSINITTTSNNLGTINNYADICDATPPSGAVKIDMNIGTLTNVTYCTCCVNVVPTITGTDTICSGQSTTLTASSATGYSWNTGATTQAITVLPFTSTSYSITSTYANGCIRIATKTVTVNPLPIANAVANTDVCNGSSIAIGGSPTASGGTSPYTYLWTPSTGLSSSTVANPTATFASNITYVITVTDTNGCINTDSAMFSVENCVNWDNLPSSLSTDAQGNLNKAGSDGWENALAKSVLIMPGVENGRWLKFTIKDTTSHFLFGFGSVLADSIADEANMMFFLEGDQLTIIETDNDGFYSKEIIGTVSIDDVIKIELNDVQGILYYKNDILIHTGKLLSDVRLQFTANIYGSGNTIKNIRCSSNN